MKLKDSLLIAYTKYRTKRIRSILAIISAAFLLSILLFMTLTGTGIRNTILDNSISANTNGIHIAAAGNYFDPSQTTESHDTAVESEKKRLNLAGISYKNIYTSTSITSYFGGSLESADLATVLQYGMPVNLEIIDEEMMSLYVNEDTEISLSEKTSTGAFPALVSIDLVTEKHKSELEKYSSAKAKQEAINTYKEELMNKDVVIKVKVSPIVQNSVQSTTSQETDRDTEYEIKIRIAGFLPASSSFISSFSGTTIPPQIQLPRDLTLGEPFVSEAANLQPSFFFATFDSKEDRKKLIDAFSYGDIGIVVQSSISPYGAYADPSAATDGMYDVIRNAFKFFIIVMLLFVTLPMSGTISKILADSERETGVFRAIGAKNRDIFKIYLVYSAILATIAYIAAFIIASALSLYITIRYAGSFAGELSVFSGGASSYDVVFFGINPAHLLFLYALIVLSAMLGVVGPVIRTLRKDPVVAMRED